MITTTHRALATKVLAAANTRVEGTWSAYIAAVPGEDHNREEPYVLAHGVKLLEPIARILFPEFDDLPYSDPYRGTDEATRLRKENKRLKSLLQDIFDAIEEECS